MGFWKKLFGKKQKKTEEAEDWNKLVFDRENIDFTVEEQRSRYIMDCLEQATEASREEEKLSEEYSLVTAYLMDMEEIEKLPENEMEALKNTAKALQTCEQNRTEYRNRESKMSDADFYAMKSREQEVEEAIDKMKNAEKQSTFIKQDLVRLDRERHGYIYRKDELKRLQDNFRGMALIFAGALVICLAALFIMQVAFEMDVMIGYFVATFAAVLAIAILCLKYLDAQKEEAKIKRAINKIIQLQNKVKIRYVNNMKLLDYLYLKYETDSCSKLERNWKLYQKEKEERQQAQESELRMEEYQRALIRQLSKYQIRDPYRWINQVEAILDSREMVEIRHGLILRRQSLRDQMDYNTKVADNAYQEIREVADLYPQYSEEILGMIERYRQA